MTKIAAIIPLYNGAAHIQKAIDSAVRQTRQPDEIIIVDDGSTDAGPDIVQKIADGNQNLRLLRKQNGGQGSARNFGVANTDCEFIAFLDQDDYWYDHHLATLEQAFLSKDDGKLGYVYSNPDRVDENDEIVIPRLLSTMKNQDHPKTSLHACLSRNMLILLGSALIRRTALLSVGGFDEQFRGYEDDDLFLRLFLAGYRAEYLDEALFAWRDNKSSTSYSPWMKISRELYFNKVKNEVVRDNEELRPIVANRFAKGAYGDLKKSIKNNDKRGVEESYRQMVRFIREASPSRRLSFQFKALLMIAKFKLSR